MSHGNEIRPPTEKVSAGVSPRTAALAACALLVGVVWLGVSGRGQEAAQPEPSEVALATLPVPSVSPTITPRPTSTPPRPERLSVMWRGAQGEDAFALTAWIEDRFFYGILDEIEPGHLQASVALPYQHSTTPAEIELVQLWTREDRRAFERVASHELTDRWLVPGGPYMLLSDDVEGQPERDDASRLIRAGYTLKVSAGPSTAGQSVLTVDVVLNRARLGPPELAGPRLEARIVREGELLAAVGLSDTLEIGSATGRIMVYDRFGPTADLQLVWNSMEPGVEPQLLASESFEPRMLRREHPAQTSGEFLLESVDGTKIPWRYHVSPVGTGSRILLVVSVELADDPSFDAATQRLIDITRGWQDYGLRGELPRTWSCWSHGEVC